MLCSYDRIVGRVMNILVTRSMLEINYNFIYCENQQEFTYPPKKNCYLRVFAMTSMFGQKKSSALTARAMKRSTNHIVYRTIPMGKNGCPNWQYSKLNNFLSHTFTRSSCVSVRVFYFIDISHWIQNLLVINSLLH